MAFKICLSNVGLNHDNFYLLGNISNLIAYFWQESNHFPRVMNDGPGQNMGY